MRIELDSGKILNIIKGYGWYIESFKDSMDIDIKDKINRKISFKEVLNHPCIYLMSKCNGNCIYCYQNKHLIRKNKNLSIDDIKKFLDDLSVIQDNGNKSIELFGGEPLLRKDIFEIVRLIKSYGYRIFIATNGTLPIIKDKKFLELCKEGIHIRISLDGHHKDLHEKYRTKNSFEKIVKNISILVDNKIDISVKSIITNDNFNQLKELLSFIKALGVKEWNYNVLYNLEESRKHNIKSNINHLDMVKELFKEKYYKYLPMMKSTPFHQMIKNVFVKNTDYYRRNYIFLNYDKRIYMNDQLIVPEYSVDSVYQLEEFYLDFIDNYEINRKSCKNCFAEDYCYRGNYGELYLKDKSLISEFPTCDILRECLLYIMLKEEKGIELLRMMYS